MSGLLILITHGKYFNIAPLKDIHRIFKDFNGSPVRPHPFTDRLTLMVLDCGKVNESCWAWKSAMLPLPANEFHGAIMDDPGHGMD